MNKIKLPRVGVAVFIINRNYEYLLSTESKAGTKKVWSLPGGNALCDETIYEAVERTVMKETGCRIKNSTPVKRNNFMSYEYPDGEFYHIIFFKADVYQADDFKGTKTIKRKGKNYTLKWFKQDDFPDNLMQPLPNFLVLARASQELLD